MINYYNVTNKLHDILIADDDINSCIVGDISLIDTNKQTMFPTSYIEVNNGERINGITRFNITVACMDIIDIVKTDLPKDGNSWKGNDNKQDILNTMFAVLENLDRAITKGSLADEGWELQGSMNASRFEDSLGNLLTGWSVDFTVDVPNEFVNCAVIDVPKDYAIKCIAANNEYLSSPAGNYFGIDISDIDIEINYTNAEGTLVLLSQGDTVTNHLRVQKTATAIVIYIKKDGVNQIILFSPTTGDNSSGRINITSLGTDINVYFNGILIKTGSAIGKDIPDLSSHILYFSSLFGDAKYSAIYSYIKINDHEWTFPEGNGNTTTNSQGVVTTLNSDVSTDNMWRIV